MGKPSRDQSRFLRPERSFGRVLGLVLISIAGVSGAAVLVGGAPGGAVWTLSMVFTVVALIAGVYIYDREQVRDPRTEQLGPSLSDGKVVGAVVEASPDGVVIVDPDRNVLRINHVMAEVAGISAPEATGMACSELFGCHADGEALTCGDVCPFERAFGGSEPVEDVTIESRNGSEVNRLVGSFTKASAGNDSFAVGSLRDITSAKEMEELQDDFVSIVSHELRGPLTAIKGFVQTLLRKSDQLPEETREEFLVTIDQQADYLNQLVEDLLNVSRIDSKRLGTQAKEIDLPGRVDRLVNDFRPKWGGRKVIVTSEAGLPMVEGDPKKVDEILINLIDNAIKYSPEGGEVRVTVNADDGHIVVSIEDSGIGIAPDDAARLFQKFHRIATPETAEIGGTGLGLYIVKGLVEAHGGRIWLDSAPGVGTTFTFTLPSVQRGSS